MGHSVYQVNTLSEPSRKPRGAVSLIYDGYGNRKYLTTVERAAFLKATNAMPADVCTFCHTLAYTGGRLSEILAITPTRVDLEAGVVVLESLKKRRHGVFRAIPLPQSLLGHLDATHHIRERRQQSSTSNERLWPWCRTTAWHRVVEAMAAAHVRGPQASPKGLRHAFAVSALQAKVPINFVKRWLGHARLTTTEIYTDAVGPEEQVFAAQFWQTF